MDKETLVVHRKNFGQRLKDLRESQGISLDGMAHSTRISSVFIKALEEGEFEKLPGQVFGRGFVKSLAKTMGVSELDWAQAYNDACGSEALSKTTDKLGGGRGDSIEGGNEGRKMLSQSRTVAFDRRGFGAVTGKFLRRWGSNPMAVMVFGAVAFAAVIWLLAKRDGGLEAPRFVKVLKERLHITGSSELEPTHPRSQIAAVPVEAKEPLARWEISWRRMWSPHWFQDDLFMGDKSGMLLLNPRNMAGSEGPVFAQILRDLPGPISRPLVTQSLPDKSFSPSQDLIAGNREASDSEAVLTPDGEVDQVREYVAGSLGSSTDSKDLQVVSLSVKEPLKVKIGVDGEVLKTIDLKVDQHLFQFKDRLDLLIYDASALSIQFNGDDLGPLGQKGRIRRLTFKSRNDLPEEKKDPIVQ